MNIIKYCIKEKRRMNENVRSVKILKNFEKDVSNYRLIPIYAN